MDESAKSRPRREQEGFFDRYITGAVIDIGAGADLVAPGARRWDLEDGDAQKLDGVADETYDTVYSSHCLEHMRDPLEALLNWWRVLRPGGHLVFAVPDEDLYEQGIFPSVFNPDHKWTYTISKDKSWSPRSKNLIDLLRYLPSHRIVYLRTIDGGYDYARMGENPPNDQTLGPAEAAIEVVVQKLARHLPMRSTLANVVQCPRCAGATLVIRGVTSDRKLDVLCESCGVTGQMAFQP